MLPYRGAGLAALLTLGSLTLWGGYQAQAARQAQPQQRAGGGERVRGRQTAASAVTPLAAPVSPGQIMILDKTGKPSGECPLKHTDVKADIAGYMARVTVTQDFVNTASTPIEAVYTFPLPDDAAIDDMTMQIGTRTIKGEIKRREEAREIYEAARTAGKTASLLDQERPNIFTQAIANVMPGEKIRITIRYVNLLKYQEGVYEWAFPLVVGPRYTSAGGLKTPGQRGDPSPPQAIPDDLNDVGTKPLVTDADKITPPITPPNTRAGHDVSLTVHLDAGLPLHDVRSVLHAIDTQQTGPTSADIRLQDKTTIPNKDFILRYTAAGSEMQEGMLTSLASGGGGYFTLIVQPPLAPPKAEITPKEMVFVIDQTGSQSGWPIQKAKETMRHCIGAMNPDDTFQLLAFNTENHPCFAAPVHNSADNVQKALKFLEPIEGNGGTDILKAADYALKIPDDPDRLRIVCYMTDGYVGNDMQIIDFIGKNRGRARMFPFGVGGSVNRFLIEGMAREGRGASEYVTLNEAGEVAAARFYKRIASPLLLDPQIDWNGMPVADVFPRHIPDVFSAGPIIVKGRYTHPGAGDITLRGLVRGKPWQRTLHVVFPSASTSNPGSGGAIPTLWAREKIEDLQQQDWLGAQSGKRNEDITNQIIATALEYRLMSQYTSFVAVEEKIVNAGGQQRRVDVPVEMPEGVSYDGIFGAEDKQQAYGYSRSRGANGAVALRSGMSLGRSAGRGYFGGMIAGKPSSLSAGGLSAAPKSEMLSESHAALADNRDIADGTAEGQKRLTALKPEERRKLLVEVKLAPALRDLAAKVKKEGKNGNLDKPGLPHVANGRVDIQIWLSALPADGLAKLKAAGFDLNAALQPGKLLLGTIEVEKLESLLELSFVRRIEPPKFK